MDYGFECSAETSTTDHTMSVRSRDLVLRNCRRGGRRRPGTGCVIAHCCRTEVFRREGCPRVGGLQRLSVDYRRRPSPARRLCRHPPTGPDRPTAGEHRRFGDQTDADHAELRRRSRLGDQARQFAGQPSGCRCCRRGEGVGDCDAFPCAIAGPPLSVSARRALATSSCSLSRCSMPPGPRRSRVLGRSRARVRCRGHRRSRRRRRPRARAAPPSGRRRW
jgi:hypothetical protein